MFAPAMFLGIIGGLLGATFTIMNLKMSRLRRRIMTRIRHPMLQKMMRFFEPAMIIVSTSFPNYTLYLLILSVTSPSSPPQVMLHIIPLDPFCHLSLYPGPKLCYTLYLLIPSVTSPSTRAPSYAIHYTS